MVLTSISSLLLSDLYRDNARVTAGWFGNDLVTLLVATPLLVVSLIRSYRGSPRAQLVWIGMLDYAVYNYAYYLFGAAFNSLFLVYVVLVALSMFSLIFALVDLGRPELRLRFRTHALDRWIAGFMGLVALGLTTVYALESLRFAFTGQLPQIIVQTDTSTSIVFALDLTLVVPWFVLGALWLWQHKPWGYVIAVISNVKGAVYMLALSAVTISAAFETNTPEDLAQVGLWAFIGVGNLVATLLLLGRTSLAPIVREAQ
jgi:hypothetical protein